MFKAVTTLLEVETSSRLAATIWHEYYTPIIGHDQVVYMLDKFQSPQAIQQQIEHDGFLYYLITDESDREIGYIGLQPQENTLFISKFYLLHDCRRKGYGRKAMRFIEQQARELGLDRLSLTVNRHNSAVKAYKRLGFNEVGPQVQNIGDGYVMDDYVFEKHVITLEILYRDTHYIAVNKPSGLLVHRSMIDKYETDYAMQILRDQIGEYVYPVHRLDKPTSGVLLFALSSEAARAMGETFETGNVKKSYLAVVRGYTDEQGEIDYPLKEVHDKMTDAKADKGKTPQSAFTRYERLGTVELPYSVSRYPTSRYSLVALYPSTGRKHQLRRHMKHIQHPIIGDTKYGRTEHNNLFRKEFDLNRLLLHARTLTFVHPYTGEEIAIEAPLEATFSSLIERFD
jgi:tRNA pseudouridine65 synthase